MTMVFCKGCGKEIHETASSCPHCGAVQSVNNNSDKISNDARLMLLAEARKKSGWLAAFLNLFIPGAGYMYCGRIGLGIFVLLFWCAMIFITYGIWLIVAGVFAPVLFIDGFLAAGRQNKKMLTELIEKTA